MRFVVSHDGDSSVGLPGEVATVSVDVESYAEEVRGDYIEQVRDALRLAFGRLWDTQVSVMTQAECQAEAASFEGQAGG